MNLRIMNIRLNIVKIKKIELFQQIHLRKSRIFDKEKLFNIKLIF